MLIQGYILGLDDLCVRFIINLPREELESVERICFQVEEAQWFYEDFIRPLDPNLPSLSLRAFALRIFQHCPLMSQWSHYHHSTAFSEFLAYKTRVPVRGAILLNEEMDEVVLVKGWKKNANWSFPRGKINKDEKDLDCAVREVYEETGFDIKDAGLIKDEKRVKYIEINMREQNMRLYVIGGVSKGTYFEPRTRKEISRIEWVKLSDLPTLKKLPAVKKNKQVEADQQSNLAGNASKFYMVAPFLVPLKKWIARQKRMDPTKGSTLQAPPMDASTAETFTEEEGPMENSYDNKLPSDLPEVSVAQDPSTHLKRLLNINSHPEPAPHQSVSPQIPQPLPLPQPQAPVPDNSQGNVLLNLLWKGTNTGNQITGPQVNIAPGVTHESFSIQPPQASAPPGNNYIGNGSFPHARFLPVAPDGEAANNQFQNRPVTSVPLQHPPGTAVLAQQQPPFIRNETQPYPLPSLSHQSVDNMQPVNPPHFSPYTRVDLPSLNTGMPPHSANNVERRFTPAPYQRTGDPEFARDGQTGDSSHSIPPASKLPPPKLTSQSLALLNVFKGESSKPAKAGGEPHLSQSREKGPATSKGQQQNKLLDLLRQSSESPTAGSVTASSPSGRVELAAPTSPRTKTVTNRPSPKGRESGRQTPAKATGEKGTGTQSIKNESGFQKASQSGPKVPQTKPVPRAHEKQTKPSPVILSRPKSAKQQATPIDEKPRTTAPLPNSNVKLADLTKVTKPFQPKILRRPDKDNMDKSLPSDTVTVSEFSHRSRDVPIESKERKGSVESTLSNRQPTQNAEQKETLLSLFGKPKSPTIAQPNQAVLNSVQTPASDVVSPFGKQLPSREQTPTLSEYKKGRNDSIASVVSQSTSRSKATSPADKAFLLGYLEGVAKGKN